MFRRIVLALMLAVAVRAQEPPPAETPAPAPGAPQESAPRQPAGGGLLRVAPSVQVMKVDPAEGTIFLVGDVDVRIADIRLRCDSLVAWLADRKDEPAPPPGERAPLPGAKAQEQIERVSHFVKEIYAEGTIQFEQFSPQGLPERVAAEAVFLDLARQTGLIVDASLVYPLQSPGRKPIELHVRAEEVRLLASDRIQALGVKTSTCTFGHPHYHLSSTQLEIAKERAGVVDAADPHSPLKENYHLDAQGNVLKWGTTPVFWIPNFVGDSAAQRPFDYIEDARLSQNSQFGFEAGLTLGDDIRDDRGRWGHWSVPLQWLSKRGPGAGVDLVYGDLDRGRSYEGRLITRYQRDHGEDENFDDPPTKNRGRISYWHRQRLPWEVQMDLELSLFSDRGYYPTYFENEEKGEKPPENLVYLKKAFFNSWISALYTIRFNDWETVREYQPELRYDLVYEPLFDLFGRPVYLNTTARVSHTRLQFDEDLDIRPRGSWRADVDVLAEYPFPVGPLIITPFVGPRYTWFEEDVFERRGQDRTGITAGATLSFQAWKHYDAFGGLFDLDGLRHVIYPEITFRNTSGVDLHPEELIPFDEVDEYDNVQVFELGVRNLLQTVRHREGRRAVENVVDLEVKTRFFPNAGRDNDGEPWGNLESDLILRFRDDLQLATDSEYNFYRNGFDVGNIALGYTPSPEFQTYLGYRHFTDNYDAVFIQQNWRVEEKWMLTLESSYDFFEDRGLDHRFVVTRIGHDWILEIGLKADLGEDDYGVTFSFEPRALFDPTLKPRALRSEPRLLYLGSGLTN